MACAQSPGEPGAALRGLAVLLACQPVVSDRGAKDTVYLRPTAVTRIAVYVPGHTDERNPYMFHCHILLHEDLGMMGQFLVVAPGRENQVPAGGELGHARGHK